MALSNILSASLVAFTFTSPRCAGRQVADVTVSAVAGLGHALASSFVGCLPPWKKSYLIAIRAAMRPARLLAQALEFALDDGPRDRVCAGGRWPGLASAPRLVHLD